MNLEQVKEHFKYAKEVRCLVDDKLYDITKCDIRGIYKPKYDNSFWVDFSFINDDCQLYDIEANQLAEILTYVFERGEEVEVSDDGKQWTSERGKFLTFDFSGDVIVQLNNNYPEIFKHIRKLQPQSLLEPELTALKDKAKEKGMNVTVIFENK